MNKMVSWWSGGITSAVAGRISQEIFGKENVRFIFIDTKNEDTDTYRFLEDCEKWYGKKIEVITAIDDKFPDIQSVWRHYKSLNVANGAICSATLKRDLRKKWEKANTFNGQIFGFDINEAKRAKSMALNYPKAKPLFPLLLKGLSKKDCLNILQNEKIKVPRAYKWGFLNNNCLKTGCVQGGIGYWQKMKIDFPDKFDKMAAMEHELTEIKGKPVTMLKDQGKNGGLVFLKHNTKYPHIKDISMMKGRPPKPLFECNGFGCAVNDLIPKNETAKEINQLTFF